MSKPIEQIAALTIGTVESASPSEIWVLLEPSAPQSTAINAGIPTGFPRINSYLLIPNESGSLVGMIVWLGVERSQFPKRTGLKDFGLVDLPFPLRKIRLTPVGTLVSRNGESASGAAYQLERGVTTFPSVGDTVQLPTAAQLRCIIEASRPEDRRVRIGTSPLASNAIVTVDPDKMFGRHLAVLGNTGSGKSCTVAGLIRWSLKAAQDECISAGRGSKPNARFIILDPNGEYATAFADIEPKVRLFQVEGKEPIIPLRVPSWLWNGDEWAAFTGAAPGVQRPILYEAIRRLRSGAGTPDSFQILVRGRIKRYQTGLRIKVQNGDHMASGRREGVASFLRNAADDIDSLRNDASCTDEAVKAVLSNGSTKCREIEEAARGNPKQGGGFWHNDFAEQTLEQVQAALRDIAQAAGIVDEEVNVVAEDTPVYFPTRELPDYVEALAADASGRDMAQFVDSLNLRIRGLFAPGPLASIVAPDTATDLGLADWLETCIGADQASNGHLAVIDLSLVPSEAVHVVVAVLARMVFEAVQRYRRGTKPELPTVLILDEAHTFIHKDLMAEHAPPSGKICCKTFERIAREGRKFGLGLVLASQRPSEVSPTVLSQCNTFLLHRIVNDRDQELVAKLVPDNLSGLLKELPSLPSRQAILLGWASTVPTLVEFENLDEKQRPHSSDPSFWAVWTRQEERPINWREIVTEWTGI